MQLCGIFDSLERDNRDRLQPADPERPDIRGCLLSERQNAARGEEPSTTTNVEPTMRSSRFHRTETTAAPAFSLRRRGPSDRRCRE